MANFKLNQTGEQIQADLNLLDSNSATQGQVLTANGTGGATWQNASGTQLYKHNITVDTNDGYNFRFSLYTADSDSYSSYSAVCTYMFDHGSTFYLSGIVNYNSNSYPLMWIIAGSADNMEFHYLEISQESAYMSSTIVGTDIIVSIDDTVTPL